MWPVAKTIALGGVAIGNMNPQLAASATGMRSIIGSIPRPLAMDATMGRNTAADAVLLASSDMRSTTRDTMATSNTTGTPDSAPARSPIHDASPLDDTAAARVRPPPKSMRMDHGNVSACAHVNTPLPGLMLASTNMRMAPAMAMLASLRPGMCGDKSGRLTHASAVASVVSPTVHSVALKGPSAASSLRIMLRCVVASSTGFCRRERTSNHHETGSATIISGTPRSIHCAKPISMSSVFCVNPASSALGGVPMSVPNPPILAA